VLLSPAAWRHRRILYFGGRNSLASQPLISARCRKFSAVRKSSSCWKPGGSAAASASLAATICRNSSRVRSVVGPCAVFISPRSALFADGIVNTPSQSPDARRPSLAIKNFADAKSTVSSSVADISKNLILLLCKRKSADRSSSGFCT